VDHRVHSGHGGGDQVDVGGAAGEERVNGPWIGAVQADHGSALCRENAQHRAAEPASRPGDQDPARYVAHRGQHKHCARLRAPVLLTT
jgi:hypothetical protein